MVFAGSFFIRPIVRRRRWAGPFCRCGGEDDVSLAPGGGASFIVFPWYRLAVLETKVQAERLGNHAEYRD